MGLPAGVGGQIRRRGKMLDADVERRPACHALALRDLAWAVGAYLAVIAEPEPELLAAQHHKAIRKVNARREMAARYKALEG